MTADALLAALALPPRCRVERRVPRAMLAEQVASTAAARRAVQQGIESLHWVAALKPVTIGVPESGAKSDHVEDSNGFRVAQAMACVPPSRRDLDGRCPRDGADAVVEIAVMRAVLSPEAHPGRLIELIHRAIPYPVVLVAEQAAMASLSVACKHPAENGSGKFVLEGEPVVWTPGAENEDDGWLGSLALGAQPQADLRALYGGWVATLEALQAGLRTGKLVILTDPAAVAARRQALAQYARLECDVAALRAQAAKERQTARRVELNLECRRLEARLAALTAHL